MISSEKQLTEYDVADVHMTQVSYVMKNRVLTSFSLSYKKKADGPMV